MLHVDAMEIFFCGAPSLASTLAEPHVRSMQLAISTDVWHHFGIGRGRSRFMTAAYRMFISA